MCSDDNCEECKQKRSVGQGVLKGLLTLGAIAGTALFLFKTEKGEEVRKKARKFGEEVKDRMEDAASEFSEKGQELKEKAEIAEEDLRAKVKDLTDEKRVELEEKLQKIKVEASSLWDKIQDFSKDVQKSAVKRFGEKKKSK